LPGVTFTFKAASVAMTMLDQVFRSNLHVDGVENLSNNPTLYVVNHFTRSETLLLPYVIYKYKQEMVHSLADSTLFHGRLGNALRSVGAISTREPFRNRKIIQELMTGQHNWVIFPEGLMVKNKRIYENGRPMLDNPERKGPPHTGAAVLALKAEIIKRNYLQACKRQDVDRMKFYEERYNFNSREDLCFKDIVITPVNISYHPVRPGQNFFISVARLFSKNLDPRVEEELNIEGNILLSKTDINIYFGKPIGLFNYLDNLLPMANSIFPFIDEVKRSDWIVTYQKNRLTRDFMNEIYTKVAVNIDHLFSSCIRYCTAKNLSEKDLKTMIYLIATELEKREDRRLHPSLNTGILQMVSDHLYEPFENICKLAENDNILTRKDGLIQLNISTILNSLGFHTIRLKNLTSVFANEIEPLKKLIQSVKKISRMNQSELRNKLTEEMEKQDLEIYHKDHHRYRSELGKPHNQGAPFILKNSNASLGVVLCHGYLSSPAEIRPLAEYLHQRGFSVYGVRLRGHGTAPHQLKDIHLQDWIDSFDRAYVAMRHQCRHLVLGGFSAGGLMALLAAANKQNFVQGVFSINAALNLKDIRTRFVPTVTLWNDLLEHFHINTGKFEYIENISENPEVNYSRNYLNGVKVLDQLISRCRSRLDHVIAPALILQADKDPIVSPSSGPAIRDAIHSDVKQLEFFDYDRHIIIKPDDTVVFERVAQFLDVIRRSSGAAKALIG
jgi:esterase/lipase